MLGEEDLIALLEYSIPFKPVYRPYNEDAEELTNEFYQALELPKTPAKKPKYTLVLASFLAAFQALKFNGQDILSVLLGNGGYSQFPDVGRVIFKNTYDALIRLGSLELFQLGEREFTKNVSDPTESEGAEGTFSFIGRPTLCYVDDSIINHDLFWSSEFVEVGRPCVSVGKALSEAQRYWLEKDKKPTPKIEASKLEQRFGNDYIEALEEVQSLNAFWEENPICIRRHSRDTNLSYNRYGACTTRVFHQGSMTKGGRFYGLWTSVRKEDRKAATIHGQPTVQIDISASQPTLFSCFMGQKILVRNEQWEDIYSIIEDHIPPSATKVFGKRYRREKIKQVIVEMIGTGNPHKVVPAESEYSPSETKVYSFSDKEYGKDQITEFQLYRNIAKWIIPSLKSLSKQGGLDTHFLSYHEANIMYETLINLKRCNIVAYPVHDCLIVQEEHAMAAANEYRSAINDYCKANFDMPFSVLVPLTIEGINIEKEVLSGKYC